MADLVGSIGIRDRTDSTSAIAHSAAPPPFLVYRKRLYVLARKAPVLDHRQVELDSIFGAGDEPRSPGTVRARRPVRPAVRAPPARDRGPAARRPSRKGERDPSEWPRFVPRDI